MSGTIQYRLVVEDPATQLTAPFTPGDATVDDGHFWVTSRPADGHAWIKEPPSGDGQKLDPVTGKVTDGEYTISVIDVPEEVCTSWTGTLETGAVTLDDYDTTGGWTIVSDPDSPYNQMAGWWGHLPGTNPPIFNGSVLFGWNDDGAGHTVGPWVRSSWIEKVVTGLTPGATYGITFDLTWSLDTGPGNIFVEIEGASGASRMAIPSTGNTFWTYGDLVADTLLRLRATADGSGEVTIRMGGENYAPSANVNCGFADVALYELTCASYGAAGGARYVTSWLADTDARQRLMGRRAWVEQTTDDGATWSLLLAGYVTSLQMDASLVYVFTVGDTRRIERTRGAWREIAPSQEADFRRMTALIGGPVYQGFAPYSPKFALPKFRVKAAQLASGNRAPTDIPDGWVRLDYVSGPMPPGFRAPGTTHSVTLAHRTLNDRANQFFDEEASWNAASPSGSFPGLRATLFDADMTTILEDDLVPLGQNYIRKTYASTVKRILGWRRPISIERGQEFINMDMELLLRWGRKIPFTTLVGSYVYLLLTPRDVSEEFPLYWRGHPVDLEAALLARHGIPVDATTQATVRNALGADLTVVLRFTDPAQTVQDVCDMLHAAFGYATRVNDAGEREFIVYRALVDTTPILSAATNDLRDEGGPTFALDEGSRTNRVIVKQQYFRTIDFDDEETIANPDAVETVDSTITFDYSTDGGATLDADTVGPLEVSYSLLGHICLKSDGPVLGDYEASAPVSQREYGAGIARQLFARAGRGVQEATIVTRRDAAGAAAARIGDPFDVDVAHIPNAQLANTPTSQRGGTRWWRVMQRTEAPEGAEIVLADAGTGVAYGETLTPTVTPDAYDPEYYYTVSLADTTTPNTDRAWVEVRVGLGTTAPTDDGVLWTILDTQQMVDGTGAVVDPWTYRLGPIPPGTIPWVRVRAFLVGGSPGAWSAWTSLGTVGGDPGVGLSDLVVTGTTVDKISLAWGNDDATNNVRVQYRLNDTGAWTTAVTGLAGITDHTITGLTIDSLYGVRVVLWDGAAEVGSALTGRARTKPGDLAGLVISAIAQNGAVAQWGNTHPTFSVKVEIRVTGTATYSWFATLQPTSVNCRLTGLTPSTSYDVRVVLQQPSGAEYGTALTDSFATLAASGTLAPPTNPQIFAGTDPSYGGFSRGLYGLKVYADTSNPPHAVVIEEAVETAVGSGVPGAYSEVDMIPAQYYGPTVYTTTCPNDLLHRWLRAFARLSGYADSAATTGLEVDPWDVTVAGGGPITGSVSFTESGMAEDAMALGFFPIPTGAIITIVKSANSQASRLQLYESDAARTADAGRDIVQLPMPGTGVILDVVFMSPAWAINLNPLVQIVNRSDPPEATTMLYYRVTRYEPGSGDCAFTLTYQVAPTVTSGGGVAE